MVKKWQPNQVKDVISRAKGKARGPVLAEHKPFQEVSRAIVGRPGLFLYASYRELGKMVRGIRRLGAPEESIMNMMESIPALG